MSIIKRISSLIRYRAKESVSLIPDYLTGRSAVATKQMLPVSRIQMYMFIGQIPEKPLNLQCEVTNL